MTSSRTSLLTGLRRSSGLRRLASAVIVWLAAVPSIAGAASGPVVSGAVISGPSRGGTALDAASAHAGLRAYDRYLRAAVAQRPAMTAGVDALVSSLAERCPGVLSPLEQLPDGAFSADAAEAFGAELGYDIGVALVPPIKASFATLDERIRSLRWSKPARGARIERSFAAQRRAMALAGSDLCADAAAFMADPTTTPPATARFDSEAAAAYRGAGLARFVKILSRLQTRRDRALVRRINHNLTRLRRFLDELTTDGVARAIGVLDPSF